VRTVRPADDPAGGCGAVLDMREVAMKHADIAAIRDVPSVKGSVSPEEWQVRVDLAGLHHVVDRVGWNWGIGNHAAARVPGEPGRFLLKPDVLLWDEVTASNLIKVDLEREWYESDGVNRPGYVLHSTILRARPDVACTLHVHTEGTVVIGCLKEGLQPMGRDAFRFMNRIGYLPYTGRGDTPEERALTAESLGNNIALMMRNHGATVVGNSVAETFRLASELIDACDTQVKIMSTGGEVLVPPEQTWKKAQSNPAAKPAKSNEPNRAEVEWAGWLRMLDRAGAQYRQ
jgi:ribulose-5-phosphate 4-epimerase/fuculose-1-phosphate aldolase